MPPVPALWLALLAAAAVAAAPAHARALRADLDRTKVIRLDQDAGAVMVGNPVVADVTLHDRRLLLITGKNFGATNVVVLDGAGQIVMSTDVIVGDTSPQRVTMHRGRARETYNCSPHCEVVPYTGDAHAHFLDLTTDRRVYEQNADVAATPQ